MTEQKLIVDGANLDRVTSFSYDFRNRLDQTQTSDGTTTFIAKNTWDDLDRNVEFSRYHTAVDDANRTALTKTYWDDRNRVYKDEIYAVPSGGANNVLPNESCYDPSGNAIKQISAGSESATKTVYDGIDRPTKSFFIVNPSGSSDNNDVSNDTVIAQSEPTIRRGTRSLAHAGSGSKMRAELAN